VEPRRDRLGIAPDCVTGTGHRADEGRQRRVRRQARRLPCRPHRPGPVRQHLRPTGPSPTTARCSSASAPTQRPLATMLESMAGLTDGVRDALTRYTQPLSGAYYFVPSTESLRRLSS
jgi:hypothetical protein